MNVAVLGASDNPSRYSYKAVNMLKEYDHTVFPIHPSIDEIEGLTVFPEFSRITQPVDTVTVYLSRRNSESIADALLALAPRRVIFNPGAENADLAEQLRNAGVEVIEACTLVMLKTGQF